MRYVLLVGNELATVRTFRTPQAATRWALAWGYESHRIASLSRSRKGRKARSSR